MSLENIVRLKNRPLGHLILTIISALLFSLPWMGFPIPTQFIAFIPLFIIADNCKKKVHFWLWFAMLITLWTSATTYWIVYAATIGLIAAILVSITLFSISILSFYTALKKAKRVLAYTIFISSWLALEYIYMWNEQISHPWLVVGNAFAINTKLIQWYEFTGVLGGSLWALLSSVVLYEAVRLKSRKGLYWFAGIIIIPITLSLSMFYSYEERHDPITITAVQPNIDPYEDKFNGMSNWEQLKLIESLALKAPKTVNYIIAPETAINDNIDVDNPSSSRSVHELQQMMREKYPESELIIGATLFKFYPKSTEKPTHSARELKYSNLGGYYDVINGSMQINAKEIETYNKTRLVIGVEMLPFPQFAKYISALSVDLGGVSGALLPQTTKEVFSHAPTASTKATKVSANICYESIYGEFVSGFVRNGANALFIITNDGWWRDTYGYKQHFSYARLRAIETRRSVARSANTGISGIINQKGEVIESLDWDERGVVTGDINLNSKITFYTIWGDWIGRIAIYVFLISMLYYVAYIYKRKSHLN